jgi:biotin carboxylase
MSASAASARTLLVLSAARDALPVIAGVRRLGLRVVACDGTPDAPGFAAAHAGLVASVEDPDSVVEAARAFAAQTPLAGVLAAGVEVPCTVAAVADALGLAGPPLAVAAVLGDRLRTRRRLRDAGVPVPWTAAFPDVDTLCRLKGRRDGPVVVRPVERHAMGGLCLGSRVDPAWALAQAAFASPSGRVMVEDLVQGPELVAHVLLVDGEARLLSLGDRTLAAGSAPFLVEETVTWPSCHERALGERVEALMTAAAGALGLRRGALRASAVVGADGPVLLSLATGLGGGYACTHAIPLATGIDVLDVAVRIACGDDVPVPAARCSGRSVACRTLFPPSGLVTEISGVAEAATSEGVVAADVLIETGMRVDLATTRRHAAGVVVAVGSTAAAARSHAAAAADCVHIVTRAPLVRSPIPAH